MAPIHQSCSFLLITFMITIIGKPPLVAGIFRPSQWTLAHATFYGDETASATMGIYISPFLLFKIDFGFKINCRCRIFKHALNIFIVDAKAKFM